MARGPFKKIKRWLHEKKIHDENFHLVFGQGEKIETLIINKILSYSNSYSMNYEQFEQEMKLAIKNRNELMVINLFMNFDYISQFLKQNQFFTTLNNDEVKKQEEIFKHILTYQSTANHFEVLQKLMKEDIEPEILKDILINGLTRPIETIDFEKTMQLVLESSHLELHEIDENGFFLEEILKRYKTSELNHLHDFLQTLRNESEQNKAKAHFLIEKQNDSEQIIPELLNPSLYLDTNFLDFFWKRKNLNDSHKSGKIFDIFKALSKEKETQKQIFQTKESISFWQNFFISIAPLGYYQKNKHREQKLLNFLFPHDDLAKIKQVVVDRLNIEYSIFTEINEKEQKSKNTLFIHNPATVLLEPINLEDNLKQINYSELLPLFDSLRKLSSINKKIVIKNDDKLDILIESLELFTIDKENLSEQDGNLIFQGIYELFYLRKLKLSDDALVLIEKLQEKFPKLSLGESPIRELPSLFNNRINEIIIKNNLSANSNPLNHKDRF